MDKGLTEVRMGGLDYVLVPRDEYLRSRGVPDGTVDAIAYARSSIGRSLAAAREQAGLTQVALAKKLGRSQTLVSQAEAGNLSVGHKYVAAVLKACGLPKDWNDAPATRKRTKRAKGA